MARITAEEVYRGSKYCVMGEVAKDYFLNGRPDCYDERTWFEMLTVKHALLAAEKIAKEGDSVEGMFPDESSFPIKRWYEDDDDD